ncbi:MAG: bscS [Nevskia sp.]|nr:bscS [Nevskia sp.]
MDRLSFRAVLALLALSAGSIAFADDAATRQLVEQGRFWEQHEQPKRALEAWQRVLQVDPNNVEALSRLAVLSATTGDRGKAQQYLDKLNKLAPGSSALAEARRAVSGGPVAGDALSRARALAAAKDYNGAVAAYREAMAGKTPEAGLALEYYQTLGATADGWAQARDGLAELARAHPEDARYTLAYAQHLTYREASRRDGIDRLAALSENPTTAAAARPAWRQALLWLQSQSTDAERYNRYLSVAGADEAIQAHLQGLRSTGNARLAAAQGSRVREIFTQIQDDEFDKAQASIDALLQQQPRNADAHGALGVLRLRQGNYAEAERYLRQAQSEAPDSAARWREALRSATFWQHVQQAQTARDGGDNARAESEYEAAFAQPPPNAPDALRVAYADVLIERKHDAAAEKLEREVLQRSPDNPDALRGLITLLARNGRQDEALQMSSSAPANVQQQLTGLRADQLRTRAATERSAGQLPQAQADLEQALLLDPDSPWIRLDLATVLRAQGHPDQARTLLDALATSNGDLPQVRMAQAYNAGNDGDWLQALQILEHLPPDQRPPDAYVLQRRAWVNYQMQRVEAAIALRQPAEGYAIVDQAAIGAGNDPELLAAVASGWAQLGDPARAVATMRRAIDRSPNADAGLRVQYAALLLTAGQDGEFEVVADDIATHGAMSAQQQQDLDTLVVGYRVKLADRARSGGNLAEAYVQLRDVIARYPDDTRVQLALARLLAASGDLDQSAAIYQAQLTRTPDDDDVRLGLIDTRLAAGDQEGARSLIKAGLRAHADDPRYWQASGRLAETEHRRGDALEAYRRAEALKSNLTVATVASPPQLAWLDPTRPDQSLPTAVANALTSVAPSTGPLRPRASSVALPPPAAAAAPTEIASSKDPNAWMSFALGLGIGQHSVWVPTPTRAPTASKTEAQGPESQAPGSQATAAPAAGASATSTTETAALTSTPAPTLASNINRLEAETSGWVGGALTTRSRAGQAGLGQLSDIEVPVEWCSRETRVGRFGVNITPVYLDAGSASGSDKFNYGTVALIAGANASNSGGSGAVTADAGDVSLTHSAGGAAVDLNYNYGLFTGDIGTTPLGFPEERLVGGIKLAINPGNWRLGLDLSRRAVTESLLSYAGEKDPLTGKNFGGVSRTGGRGDITYDAGDFGLYANGGFFSLDGRNVDSNTEITGGAGVYAKALHTDTQNLTYGLNLTTFSYDKNLRYFTFGHGGYFSPQLFLALTVPVEWSGRRGNLTYSLKGALGVQSFHEDGNSLYPGFGSLNDALQQIISTEPTLAIPHGYASQRSTGLGYAFGGVAEYRLMSRLSIGGQFGVDNARNYRELQLNGYLRYYFDEQLVLLPQAPTPILPIYGQ